MVRVRNVYTSSVILRAQYFCTISTKHVVPQHIFIKVPNIKLHGNTCCGSCADTYGHTDTKTDMTNLIGFFRDYANVPKIMLIDTVVWVLLYTQQYSMHLSFPCMC